MSRHERQPSAQLSSEDEVELELKPEQVDVEAEAGREEEPPTDQNLDHEYSIPSTIKFTWLATYFFFSLLLTLYNKLVLGMVSLSPDSLGVWSRSHISCPYLLHCSRGSSLMASILLLIRNPRRFCATRTC